MGFLNALNSLANVFRQVFVVTHTEDVRERLEHVLRVVDAGDEGPVVGVVEGRGERVEVGRDGRRARSTEGAHDVDALSCAREEDGGHDARGYRRSSRR